MPGAGLGAKRLTYLLILSAVVLLPGLGHSTRLSYHEAFVAQGAREILASGDWGQPTIGGLPWLEKPPLPWWLVAALGWCNGGVNETLARLPSALAAAALVVGVAVLGTHHYGPGIGLLAGAVQATTAWTVMRGRLAEADVLLVCLITWTLVAVDRVLSPSAVEQTGTADVSRLRWSAWRWVFFVFLSLTALVKGIGFGAVLVLSVVVSLLFWQHDAIGLRRLRFKPGWGLAAAVALIWPVLTVMRVWARRSGALDNACNGSFDRSFRSKCVRWRGVAGVYLCAAGPSASVDAACLSRRVVVFGSCRRGQRR